jgi:MSHA biogenesis protein MshO
MRPESPASAIAALPSTPDWRAARPAQSMAASPCAPVRQAALPRPPQGGFTLVELIVVILLIGILGSTVGVFLANPVRGYFAAINRAQLTDAADGAVRRLARELQGAVPNSVRLSSSGGSVYLEFVPIVAFGRYRAAASNGLDPTGTDPLDFSNINDGSFQILGPGVTAPSGSKLAIMNLGYGAFDLYSGSNVRTVTSIGSSLTSLQFTAGSAWPAASPGHRFYLFTSAVTYVCTPGTSGTLVRYYGYTPQAAQPASTTAMPLSTASQSILLDDVTACSISAGTSQVDLNAMQVNLQLTRDGESVTLYSQVGTPNGP